MGFIYLELTFVFFVVFVLVSSLSLSLVFYFFCLCPSVCLLFLFLCFRAVDCPCWVCLHCVPLPPVLFSSCFSLLGGDCLSFPSLGNLPGSKFSFRYGQIVIGCSLLSRVVSVAFSIFLFVSFVNVFLNFLIFICLGCSHPFWGVGGLAS